MPKGALRPSVLAGAEGFEPPQADSESAVLPLDDAPSSGATTNRRLGRPQLYLLPRIDVKPRDAGRSRERGEQSLRWIRNTNPFKRSSPAPFPIVRSSLSPPSARRSIARSRASTAANCASQNQMK